MPGDTGDNRIDSIRDGEIDTKLSPDDVREIRSTYAAGEMSQRDLADDFDVYHGLIWMILNGRQYAWVESEPESE